MSMRKAPMLKERGGEREFDDTMVHVHHDIILDTITRIPKRSDPSFHTRLATCIVEFYTSGSTNMLLK